MNEDNTIRLMIGGKECIISPYEGQVSPEAMPQYRKVEISESERAQISAIFQQLPSLMAAEALQNAYFVTKWPEGAPHVLTHLKDGSGVLGIILGENGQIAGQAVFQSLKPESLALSIYTILSVVTAQYFLAKINQKLTLISEGIDKILEFLYGDKKAELLSEINFARYAYENYASIMEHSDQRIATIQSLQESRKTAIQDVEFYLADLNVTVKKESKPRHTEDMKHATKTISQICECLDMSMQLCTTASLLEVFFSQNFDSRYIKYVENDVNKYISRWQISMIADLNAWRTALNIKFENANKHDKPMLREQIEMIEKRLEPLMKNKGDELKNYLHAALHSVEKAAECCIGTDGTVYLKSANN